MSETWCFNEPKRHTGIFNGVITGNCTEIIEWTDKDETAVCNLGSLALPKFVRDDKTFDYEKLHAATRALTYNLNRVIDVNFYPVEEARKSNMRHRPIGLGVQGLADTFNLCGYAFDSKEAADMNIAIFETMYHAAVTESCELAQKLGPYESFPGSPASQGILQFDMWDAPKFSGLYDWSSLKDDVKTHGIRMPGRMLHSVAGQTAFVPYSADPNRAIVSFSRSALNMMLLRAAAAHPNVRMTFDHRCVGLDEKQGTAVFEGADGTRVDDSADLVVGADGAFSAVRTHMERRERFEYSLMITDDLLIACLIRCASTSNTR